MEKISDQEEEEGDDDHWEDGGWGEEVEMDKLHTITCGII